MPPWLKNWAMTNPMKYWLVGLLLTIGAILIPNCLLGRLITALFHNQSNMIYPLYFDIFDTYPAKSNDWLLTVQYSIFSIYTNPHINHQLSSISNNFWCLKTLHIYIWLVVYLPLWKIRVRQLGWFFPIYGKSKKWCSKPPTTYYIIIHHY